MEHKIGEIFEYNGEWYQCVKSARCGGCDFMKDICIDGPSIKCTTVERSDKTSVIFKKLEKVGEPIIGKVHIQLQRYKIYTEPIIDPAENIGYVNEENTIAIEIKQTKEDMKENNGGNTPLNKLTDRYVNGSINYDEFEKEVKALYSCKKEDMKEKKIQHYDCFFDEKPSKSNLKPFDLNAAKAGKPVYTRDGRKVRIICFDRKDNTPIVALIECVNHAEILQCVHNDGKCFHYDTSNNDLMMLTEKKEGWVNVYKRNVEYIWENECNVVTGMSVYESEDEAKRHIDRNEIYVDTVKITW